MAVAYQTLIVGDVPRGWSCHRPSYWLMRFCGTRFELRDTRTCLVFR
jgi:hypothetical protein